MKYEKYLPIGSVVLLKGGQKRMMIVGFCAIGDDNQEKIYDYSGVLYPEGFISSNQAFLFDHEQIDKVYILGYSDDEEKSFKKHLIEMMQKMN